MKMPDTSRRKFLGRSGSLALALPLAAAIPAAIEEVGSPTNVEAATELDVRQPIPNRTLPARDIGTFSYPVPNMPTDGSSDCSQAINDAISYVVQKGGGTVVIPWHNTGGNRCIYIVDPQANAIDSSAYYGIFLQSGVRLQFQLGVKLQAKTINTDPGKLTSRAYMIYGVGVHDVEINNGWLVGERYTHIYSGIGSGTDEWCHGIQLLGVTAVTIRATIIADCTGDGICIGSNNGIAPSDIILCDVISTGNRRQALSITAGDSIFAYDSEFSYTHGTAPGDGIDIEPQYSDNVSNVTIDNCVIRGNESDGIQLNATGTRITNVNILDCLFSYNGYYGFATQNGLNSFKVMGVVDTGTLYGNAFFQNGNNGIQLGGNTGITTNYTIGAARSNGARSNSFGNNQILFHSFSYPNPTQTDTNGYVSGSGIDLSPDSQLASSNNLVRWNSYFTP